ncbi:Uncharacterized protein SCF082_LOCUS20953 [Durusdinium trenchii]|uniref:Uncharacterized protein n=1 Tax=Durusdinium trenchii TaxID=1381693 RepID=A0ABP0L653_9DINO
MGGVEKLSVCSLRELEAYGCRPPQVLDSEMLAPECSISYQSTTRRRPNCFTLYFQLKLIKAMDREEACSFEAWSKASEVAQAYSIGKLEAQSALNLFKEIDSEVKYTMQKFILHEAVASSVFNRNFTSGYGAWIPWEAELRNSPDILKTVCDRLGGDFEQTHAKLRKPYGMKDTETIQRRCAGFHALLNQFRSKYPEEFVKAEEPTLVKGFLLKHADAEIDVLLEESVPPADISRVGIFRAPVAKHMKKARFDLSLQYVLCDRCLFSSLACQRAGRG